MTNHKHQLPARALVYNVLVTLEVLVTAVARAWLPVALAVVALVAVEAFQFPPPNATNDAGQSGQPDLQRRGSQSSHTRQGSRNFEGNWRQQNNQQSVDQPQQQMGQFSQPPGIGGGGFQPGHRAGRGSINQSVGSMSGFQYPGQPQLMQMQQGGMMMPQMFAGQQLNALQIAQLQAMQGAQLGGLQASQHAPQLGMQQHNSSERLCSHLICHRQLCLPF